MNIQAKKYQLIEWITNINDTKIIDSLFKISEVSNWENNLSQAEIESIERGLKDLQEGRITSHDEVMKKYEKYL
ncbi:MAG: hypothetical protein V4622_07335 [Bacteroidota bacterium]